MRVKIHGFEEYFMSAKEFLDTLYSGNLYGASLECEATIGDETRTFKGWREVHNFRLRDRLEKFDGYCLKCGGKLQATAGHPSLNCNSWTCDGCGNITPEMGSLNFGEE